MAAALHRGSSVATPRAFSSVPSGPSSMVITRL